MTECVKIKCDDCKFVEDCVDYGWDSCKKFTPKQSVVQTNEEWLRSASTEQLADVIADFYLLGYTNGYNETDIAPKKKWVEWLKQPHGGES